MTDIGDKARIAAGIYANTLNIRDAVEVVGGIRPNQVRERPWLLSYIDGNSDDWGLVANTSQPAAVSR